jgi:hypothetical protein
MTKHKTNNQSIDNGRNENVTENCAFLHHSDYVVTLLRGGLESSNLEDLVIAFLFARQGCYEGPHVFASYPDWFQVLHLMSFSVKICPSNLVILKI